MHPIFPLSNSRSSHTTQPLLKSSTAVGVAVVFFVPSTITETHHGPMAMFIVIRQEPILQKEKDRRNSLALCRYCSESRHIAIDYRNPALGLTKR